MMKYINETRSQSRETSETESLSKKSYSGSHRIERRAVLSRLAVMGMLISLVPQIAAAQQDDETTYRRLIDEALKEFELANWEEARTLFWQAHQLNPNARTLRGFGIASFEARRYTEALVAFEGALNEKRKPLTQKQRAEIEKLLIRTEQFVGRYALHKQPDSAVITVDGRDPVIQANQLLLDPGRHEVVVKAEGYETVVRQIVVDGGSSERLELKLKPLSNTKTKPVKHEVRVATNDQAPKESSNTNSKSDESGGLLPWIVLGGSSAVAVTGTILLILALNDKSTVEDAEIGVRLEEIEAAHDRVPVLSTVGGVLLGVGLAGAAVAVVLLTLDDDPSGERLSLSIVPNGLSFRGAL